MKKKILVTGANGQLGKCIADVSLKYPGIDFHFFGRSALPIEDAATSKKIIASIQPDVIINTAAYTAVDKAETDATNAFLTNGEAVGNLASISKASGIRFIHISTDYVFDGTATSPYKETDIVSPLNQYGASKLKGEQLALAADDSSIIVRTSWVYSRHGNNFVKTMIRLMNEREKIGVVADQQGCPTYAIDLADALITIALNPKEGGIYHFSNSGPVTWYYFAKAIHEIIDSKCVVNGIPASAFPTPAKRPSYSVMSNKKINAVYGINQQPWKERLSECINLLMQ
jgi:dTDP-4-dehydrorhamnose reductase